MMNVITPFNTLPRHPRGTQALRLACQRGMTLIELMIGILIGLMVVAAAITTLITSSSTSRNNKELTELNQQASYALRVIGEQITQTRAFAAQNTNAVSPVDGSNIRNFNFDLRGSLDANNTPTISTDDSYVVGREAATAAGAYTTPTGSSITPANPTTPVATQPDLLTLVYQARPTRNADGSLNTNTDTSTTQPSRSNDRDCLGNRPPRAITNPADATYTAQYGPPSARRVASTFFIDTNGNTPRLRCMGINSGNEGAQTIMDNVEDFQVRYLVNITPNLTAPTYRLLNANQLGSSPAGGATQPGWDQVVAVEVCLQVSATPTNLANAPAALAPTQQQCSGTAATPNPVPNDGRLRRVFRNTFYLRNV